MFMPASERTLEQIRSEREQRCAEMRQLLNKGKSQTEIAELFGVTHQRVAQLIGRTRKVYPKVVTRLTSTDQEDYFEMQMCCGRKFSFDPGDLEKVNQLNWHTRLNSPTGVRYVVHGLIETVNGRRRMSTIQLARFLMDIERGDPRVVDHIDGNPLNNRRANLRICTSAENIRNRRKDRDNTSGFKGVTREGSKWLAQIFYGKRGHRLGRFDTPEQAHVAYCKAARRVYGEFANFG
jgi:transposase